MSYEGISVRKLYLRIRGRRTFLWELISATELKYKKVIATFYLTILTFFPFKLRLFILKFNFFPLKFASLFLAILTFSQNSDFTS